MMKIKTDLKRLNGKIKNTGDGHVVVVLYLTIDNSLNRCTFYGVPEVFPFSRFMGVFFMIAA